MYLLHITLTFTAGTAATQTATTPSAAVPKSKLNPFAREFKLNVNAPSFTPGSKPPQIQSSAASTAAGQGSSPAPAARTYKNKKEKVNMKKHIKL